LAVIVSGALLTVSAKLAELAWKLALPL